MYIDHTRPPLFTFWHGELSWLERCCLTSMIEQGHEVAVYSYSPEALGTLPGGAQALDAKTVLPINMELYRILQTRPALASDVFRYVGLAQRCGIWIDLDVLLRKPIPWPTGQFMAAFESPHNDKVNGAVLWIDHRAELLDVLLGFIEERPILPPWFSARRKLGHKFWAAVGRPYLPEESQWGIWGPKAITHFIREFGLMDQVLPRATFYPVPHEHAEELFSTEARPWHRFTDDTVATHLWGNRLRKLMKGCRPPQHSMLGYAHAREQYRALVTPTVRPAHEVH
jgi:hypothetical protein